MKRINILGKSYFIPVKVDYKLNCLMDQNGKKIFKGRGLDEDILRLLARSINVANMYPDWVYRMFFYLNRFKMKKILRKLVGFLMIHSIVWIVSLIRYFNDTDKSFWMILLSCYVSFIIIAILVWIVYKGLELID